MAHLPLLQARGLQEAAPVLIQEWVAYPMLLVAVHFRGRRNPAVTHLARLVAMVWVPCVWLVSPMGTAPHWRH